MAGRPCDVPLYWFPMRVTYRRELAVKEGLDRLEIENFLPMRYAVTGWNNLCLIQHER